MHFDVISRLHEHFPLIGTLLVGNSILKIALPSAFIEGLMTIFKKFIEKCKNFKSFPGDMPLDPHLSSSDNIVHDTFGDVRIFLFYEHFLGLHILRVMSPGALLTNFNDGEGQQRFIFNTQKNHTFRIKSLLF